MLSTELSRPRHKRARLALAAALVAVGCSGGTGGGCGSSCGGAFRTTDANGNAIKFTGSKLDNVAQVRLTSSGFNFLNAEHLNSILGALNGDSSLSQTFDAPDGTNNLVFWYRVVCPGSVVHGWATATLRDNTAQTSATVLPQTCNNAGTWVQKTTALTAKHSYTLTLQNHDANDAAGPTYTYFDDVAVVGPGSPVDPIVNGTFEAGTSGWTPGGTVELSATAHSGADAAQLGTTSPGISIPCFDAGTYGLCGSLLSITQAHVLAGDANFDGACTAADKTPVHITIKDVSWVLLPPPANVLRAHIVTHIKTGDIYVRTVEEHSSLCSDAPSAIQGRIIYDDELPGLPQKDTVVDLDIQFSTTPDGRLEFNFSDSSLAAIVTNFQPGAIWPDGNIGTDPAPPVTAPYNGDGCDAATGTYTVANPSDASKLRCSGLFDTLSAGCSPDSGSNQGVACQIFQYVRDQLLNVLKNSFTPKIVAAIRTQLDNVRCQRSQDSQGNPYKCDGTAAHQCPADDDGTALACDVGRGVCYPPAQGLGADGYNCEPIPLGIAGQIDASGLTQTVGFPPNTRLNLFAGLGSKGSGGGAKVDSNGLQLAVEAGTQPDATSNAIGWCVQGVAAENPPAVPVMDFDDGNNKPTGVGAYDVGFSLASAMLNRGFLDAYNAGMLCVAITNQTTAFISSGLFKTFLPSIGLVTGGKDVPMKILLRPTLPPFVRVGKNTLKKDVNGNDVPDDPLITLSFNKMNLDFYALVDERQVRIFTLQADLQLPLDLRTFADPNADQLQPVLGGLDTVLTNISALSPDYNPSATVASPTPIQLPYTATADMLAEDPGVVKDLLGAAVRLAQPLLAGIIKPIALPSMLGLKFAVRGVAGAVPMTDIAVDGYNHLAVWAQVGACGGNTGVLCEQYTVKTQARVARRYLPENLKEVVAGARPELELDLSALSARSGAHAQYSYRVDGSMWSPWLGSPKLVLRDPLFLVQGHHLVEVTAREAGDDHTMDPNPAAVDFFVSYEAPTVSLSQRPDGAIVTRAHSAASPVEKLFFSYRVDGSPTWTQPGPARAFTQDELGGRGLSVSVSDEAGRSAQAHFGDEEATELARAGVAGCTSSGAGTFAFLGLVALVFLRRQRKGSISAG